MTGKELLEKLQTFTQEQLNCPVCFPIPQNSNWTELKMSDHILGIYLDNEAEPWYICIEPDIMYFYEKAKENN